MNARTLSDEKCKEVLDAEYERGLNDAWRAARWIMDLTCDDVKRHDVIGDCAPKYALTKYSADEAIELIKEYEEKQAKKNCMNCGHMHPHYDTFRCNIMGTCIGREKWIPKREYEKQSKDKTIWYLCSKEQPPDPRVTYGLDFEDCEYFAVSKKYLITINDKVEIGKWTWQRNRGLRWQDYEERLYEIHPEAWMLLPEPYRKE